jgi:hypothetical protein
MQSHAKNKNNEERPWTTLNVAFVSSIAPCFWRYAAQA